MPRIVYLVLSEGGIAGGHKMIFRHVETLRDLGFDAVCYIGTGSQTPRWFSHRAPLELGTPVRPDDIVVLPDDADDAMRVCAQSQLRTVIFSQNPYYFAASTFGAVDLFPASRFPRFLAVSARLGRTIQRAFPQALVDVVPCFADERVFAPAPAKAATVAFVPRKRPTEAAAIQQMFRRFHPAHRDLAWSSIDGATETQAAAAMGVASLFLSLSRLESVGMATLEAMASDCVCAGFTGVGGDDYATPENGFWVASEDCEAAADALARAADLVNTGGTGLQQRLDAGRETARVWSYAAFRAALEIAWMGLAPEARLRNGPLD